MLLAASTVFDSRLAVRQRQGQVRMGFFDGLAAAFENDDTLSESGPAGLKNKVQLQKVTWVGPQP